MADFSLSRSTRIDAPIERVHALIDDLRAWQQWSPWEGVDPALEREYSGPERGVGATYAWSGNAKAGQGRMQITESTPTSVRLDLEFLKPFKATNVTTFTLAGAADGPSEVTWTMTGSRNPIMAVLGRLFFDAAIGKDFEKGLAALAAAARS